MRNKFRYSEHRYPYRSAAGLVPLLLSLALLISGGCGKKEHKVIARSKVTVRSIPDKVNINVISHNQKLGVTPWAGEMTQGMYVFEFSKPGYKTTWQKINCSPGSREDIEVRMEPVTASAIIETEPPGAMLTMEKRHIGETPIVLHNLSLGTHTYSLTKPGFSPREITVNVNNERPQLLTANLNSNIGTIIIRSTPPNANIFLDNAPRGKTPATITLEQGEHNLRLELPGHTPQKQKITVSRGGTARINTTLQEQPGAISIETVPADATLTVNEKQYNNTPTTIKDLKPGDYKIVVSKDKYDSSTRTVSLAAGQNLTVKITLDTNMGGIDLIAHPPGITVYVDGKKLGVTEGGETKDLSKVFEIRNLKSGKHTIRLAHKRAEPSVRNFTVEIKKGKILRPKPLRFWIRDTYLKLKDGREFTGRISQENKESILFEPDPTMRIKYSREEIEVLRPLKETE